jgi:hypothetical protein
MFSNAKTRIPKLFQAIIENDEQRTYLRSLGPDITKAEWRELKRLNVEKRDFRKAAEKMLHWNADKGALA